MCLSRNARLLVATVEHLSLRQVWFRLWYRARGQWWQLIGATVPRISRVATAPKSIWDGLPDVGSSRQLDRDAKAAVRRAEAVQARQFCFLGRTIKFEGEVDWA